MDKRDAILHRYVERNIPSIFNHEELNLMDSSNLRKSYFVTTFIVLIKVTPSSYLNNPGYVNSLTGADDWIVSVAKKNNGFILEVGGGLYAVLHGLDSDLENVSVIEAAKTACSVLEYPRLNGKSDGPKFSIVTHKGPITLFLLGKSLPKCAIIGEALDFAKLLMNHCQNSKILSSLPFYRDLLGSEKRHDFILMKNNNAISTVSFEIQLSNKYTIFFVLVSQFYLIQ